MASWSVNCVAMIPTCAFTWHTWALHYQLKPPHVTPAQMQHNLRLWGVDLDFLLVSASSWRREARPSRPRGTTREGDSGVKFRVSTSNFGQSVRGSPNVPMAEPTITYAQHQTEPSRHRWVAAFKASTCLCPFSTGFSGPDLIAPCLSATTARLDR